jgi:hypothetical protein
MNSKLKSYILANGQLLLISLSLLVTLGVVPTAIRVGVDPYHEGALFPSAVGFAQGLMIFKDVNNQYGFMYAIIHSPFVYFFGNHLIVVRIVGSLIYLLNAFLFYKIIRLRLNAKVASFSVLVLCAINPSWSYLSSSSLGGSGIWVNQYGITFTLISALILFKNIAKPTNTYWHVCISSFVSFCASFVRLEFAAVWVMQLIFLTLRSSQQKKGAKITLTWMYAGLSALILGILFLAFTASLPDAFAQLVSVWFSSPPNSAHLGLGNILTLIVSCFLFVYLIITVKLVSRFKYWYLYASLAILGNLIVMRILLDYLPDFKFMGKIVGPYLFTSFDGLLLNYSSVLFLLILYLVVSEFRTRYLGINFESGFLLATSLGLVAQLHNINSAYIFMLNPVFLACVLLCFDQKKLSMLKKSFVRPILITMSVLVLVSLVNGLFLTTKTTYNYRAPVLKGMMSDNLQTRDEIDRKFILLQSVVSGQNVFFDCPYGLYTVSENGLINADKWTWSEIPEKWRYASLSKAKAGQYLLHCGGGNNRALQYENWESLGSIESVSQLVNFRLYKVLKDNSLSTR